MLEYIFSLFSYLPYLSFSAADPDSEHMPSDYRPASSSLSWGSSRTPPSIEGDEQSHNARNHHELVLSIEKRLTEYAADVAKKRARYIAFLDKRDQEDFGLRIGKLSHRDAYPVEWDRELFHFGQWELRTKKALKALEADMKTTRIQDRSSWTALSQTQQDVVMPYRPLKNWDNYPFKKQS